MTRNEWKHGHRHPAGCPAGLGEEGVAAVLWREGCHIRHWAADCGDGTPEALLRAVPLQRRALAPVGEIRSGRKAVMGGKPLEPRMHLSIDETGIPMRAEGVAVKREDVASKVREARPAFTRAAEARDPCTGAAVKDRERGSLTCPTAGAASGRRDRFAIVVRPGRDARRRGLHDAAELAVISNEAEWMRGTCDEILGAGGPPSRLACGTFCNNRPAP